MSKKTSKPPPLFTQQTTEKPPFNQQTKMTTVAITTMQKTTNHHCHPQSTTNLKYTSLYFPPTIDNSHSHHHCQPQSPLGKTTTATHKTHNQSQISITCNLQNPQPIHSFTKPITYFVQIPINFRF